VYPSTFLYATSSARKNKEITIGNMCRKIKSFKGKDLKYKDLKCKGLKCKDLKVKSFQYFKVD